MATPVFENKVKEWEKIRKEVQRCISEPQFNEYKGYFTELEQMAFSSSFKKKEMEERVKLLRDFALGMQSINPELSDGLNRFLGHSETLYGNPEFKAVAIKFNIALDLMDIEEKKKKGSSEDNRRLEELKRRKEAEARRRFIFSFEEEAQRRWIEEAKRAEEERRRQKEKKVELRNILIRGGFFIVLLIVLWWFGGLIFGGNKEPANEKSQNVIITSPPVEADGKVLEKIVDKTPAKIVKKASVKPINTDKVKEQSRMVSSIPLVDNTIYEVVDIQAKFNGSLQNYINDNRRYPAKALMDGIKGDVSVSFVVETNGSLSNIKVVKSAEASLDREALRVVKNMPRWTPAVKDGKKVRSLEIIIISFK